MSDRTHTESNAGTPTADTGHTCPRTLDRRRFLRDATLAIGAALVASGVIPTRALADGVREITALTAGKLERAYALPATDGVWVDADSRVALVRVGRQVFAISLECPHKGRVMEWNGAENRFYCPKHKVRFMADGRRASGRQVPDLDRFALKLQQDRIVVAIDKVLAADLTPAEWAAAVLRVQ
jgi:nitrite reductase/ring-hydroxylating ferredoxin subunit